MGLRFLPSGKLLMKNGRLVTRDCCCYKICLFEGVNPDLIVVGQGGNYTPIGGAPYVGENGHLYRLTYDISHPDCVVNDGLGNPTTITPTRSYLSGVNAGNEYWAEIWIDGADSLYREYYEITCGTEAWFEKYLVTGELPPPDRQGDEWVIRGYWGQDVTFVSGYNSIVIGENTEGGVASGDVLLPTLVPNADFRVLSKNPFHAIATFRQPHTDESGYPVYSQSTLWGDCGPVTVEITE